MLGVRSSRLEWRLSVYVPVEEQGELAGFCGCRWWRRFEARQTDLDCTGTVSIIRAAPLTKGQDGVKIERARRMV
jgi:hypothetical protein